VITLTDQQETGVSSCVDLLTKKHFEYGHQVFRLGGYAGTGKTTCAQEIVRQCPSPISCAFCGKAAWRLIEKGVPGATTIHKAIYRYDMKLKRFFLKEEVNGEYFLIDEGSMVGAKIWNDILSFRKPIIIIGDPAQLQPVADDDPQLMSYPDYVLTEPHRNALKSGIIQMSMDIRLGKPIHEEYPDVEIRRGRRAHQPTHDDIMNHDVMLCGWNNTRVNLNRKYRKLKGLSGILQKGERIIVLRNDYTHDVFNGQMFEVLEATNMGKTTYVECKDVMGTTYRLQLVNKQFGNPKGPKFTEDPELVYADYAYATTVHKYQGSEADNVLVIDEDGTFWDNGLGVTRTFWDQQRWQYTAVTRAAKNLTMLYRK